MAQGDVTVSIIAVPFTESQIDAALTAMRVSANDKWMMTSCKDQIVIAHVEEA